uniref:Uncharacterized protein n=1 Tax=Arundo donax TaxID=35708 RepID=A0A0A8YW83_ARUDO
MYGTSRTRAATPPFSTPLERAK